MSKISTDIDIDFADRYLAVKDLHGVPAWEVSIDGEKRHGSGVYFQNIPVNPMTDCAAFDFRRANELGYFKVDILSNKVYEGIRNEEHLNDLMTQEPDWSLFDHEHIVEQLPQISKRFPVIAIIKPRSIEDLAVACALIRRPRLLGLTRAEIDAKIWCPADNGETYVFKRAHAIAYAVSIVISLNRLCEATAVKIDDAKDQADFDRLW